MGTMTGLYELIFATLSADATLQALLSGTALDRKVYPVQDLGQTALPAIGMAIWSGRADIGHAIERPILDLTVASKLSVDEVVAIGTQVDSLLNRKRLAGNGRVIHLSIKQFERDDFNSTTQEYTRDVRYAFTAQ